MTLAEQKDAKVWGRAFKIREDDVPEVYAYLLEREKQYDLETDFELYNVTDGEENVVVEAAKTWIATPGTFVVG